MGVLNIPLETICNLYEHEGEINCHDLSPLSEATGSLHTVILCLYEEAGTDPMAELLIAEAMHHLKVAQVKFKQAELHQTKAIAGGN